MDNSFGSPYTLVGRLVKYRSGEGQVQWDVEHNKSGHLNMMIITGAGKRPTHSLDINNEEVVKEMSEKRIENEMKNWMAVNSKGPVEDKSEEKKEGEEEDATGTKEEKTQEHNKEEYQKEETRLRAEIHTMSHEKKAHFELDKVSGDMGAIMLTVDHLDFKKVDIDRPNEDIQATIESNLDLVMADKTIHLGCMERNMDMPGVHFSGDAYFVFWVDSEDTGMGVKTNGFTLQREGRTVAYAWAMQNLRMVALKLKNSFAATGLWTANLNILTYITIDIPMHNLEHNKVIHKVENGVAHEHASTLKRHHFDILYLQLKKDMNIKAGKKALKEWNSYDIPIIVLGGKGWESVTDLEEVKEEIAGETGSDTNVWVHTTEFDGLEINPDNHKAYCEDANDHLGSSLSGYLPLDKESTKTIINNMIAGFDSKLDTDAEIKPSDAYSGFCKWASEGKVIGRDDGKIYNSKGWGWYICRKHDCSRFGRLANKNALAGGTGGGVEGMITNGQYRMEVEKDWETSFKLKGMDEDGKEGNKDEGADRVNLWLEVDLRESWHKKITAALTESNTSSDEETSKKAAEIGKDEMQGVVILTEIKQIYGRMNKSGTQLMCAPPQGYDKDVPLCNVQVNNKHWRSLEPGMFLLVRIGYRYNHEAKEMIYLEGIPLLELDDDVAYELEKGGQMIGFPTTKEGIIMHNKEVAKCRYLGNRPESKRQPMNLGMMTSKLMAEEMNEFLIAKGLKERPKPKVEVPDNPQTLDEIKKYIDCKFEQAKEEWKADIEAVIEEAAKMQIREEGTRFALCEVLGSIKKVANKDQDILKAVERAEETMQWASPLPNEHARKTYDKIMLKYNMNQVDITDHGKWKATAIKGNGNAMGKGGQHLKEEIGKGESNQGQEKEQKAEYQGGHPDRYKTTGQDRAWDRKDDRHQGKGQNQGGQRDAVQGLNDQGWRKQQDSGSSSKGYGSGKGRHFPKEDQRKREREDSRTSGKIPRSNLMRESTAESSNKRRMYTGAKNDKGSGKGKGWDRPSSGGRKIGKGKGGDGPRK